ncbi:flagellar biosynthesis protein FliQ [Candidatus Berkiella cookevillensis]|uniref:Flagellar biosynthetic protein FliQ n=1 Tax=Candidatus Berkiella cookevillensis TaxID=437022 RepID=A0A0Q9YGU7_9GAMM|nr:flagellar biosynthesis protein FliQ [Candidatus Berkiella cookevillensis]MCS5708599.1 flagellar biosynthesis protein FliQ [Candidatus Berkiella cookevillensis]
MGPESVIDLFRQALLVIILLVSIIVVPSLITGLIVSVFQAATQINEQSLSFIPRLLVTFLTLILAAPWLSSIITDFTHSVFDVIPQLIG